MPNRIIKESVCSSDTIDQMSWFEECFFHRLWVNCDDYGRMDARPAILKARLFPLKERLSLKEIESALVKLASIGCVMLYECDSKPYLCLPAWEVHQNIRAKRSKYPAPDDADKPSASTCMQMQTDDCKCPRNPIQSVSESVSVSEDSTTPEPDAVPPIITLPLNDKSEYPISQERVHEWADLYPAVDVMQQLREMRGWLLSNPERRKTKRGIEAFITRWLAKEQDKGSAAVKCPRNAAPSCEEPTGALQPWEQEWLSEVKAKRGQHD